MDGGARVVARVAAFVGIYAVTFVVWVLLGLERPLWLRPLALGAELLAPLLEVPTVTQSITLSVVRPGWFDVEMRGVNFRTAGYLFSSTIPILVALVSIVPGLQAASRLRLFLLATALLYVVNVFGLVCVIEEQYLGTEGPNIVQQHTRLRPLYRGVGHALGTHVAQMLTVLLVFGIGLSFALRTQARRARAKRNDPCPCGSGRKFKVCCGRT